MEQAGLVDQAGLELVEQVEQVVQVVILLHQPVEDRLSRERERERAIEIEGGGGEKGRRKYERSR